MPLAAIPPLALAAEGLHDALVEARVHARHRYRHFTTARMIELQGEHLIEGVPQIALRRVAVRALVPDGGHREAIQA